MTKIKLLMQTYMLKKNIQSNPLTKNQNNFPKKKKKKNISTNK